MKKYLLLHDDQPALEQYMMEKQRISYQATIVSLPLYSIHIPHLLSCSVGVGTLCLGTPLSQRCTSESKHLEPQDSH